MESLYGPTSGCDDVSRGEGMGSSLFRLKIFLIHQVLFCFLFLLGSSSHHPCGLGKGHDPDV